MSEWARLSVTIRNFLFSKRNREFLIFLFFLSLSGIFWLLMTLNETYEKELAVPIHITNIPADVMLTSDTTDTVRITVRDRGILLLTYMYGDHLNGIEASFKNYDLGNGNGSISGNEINKLIQQHLSSSAKIINSKRLLQAIEKVGFAIANDELRPVMNGVHFDFFKDAMVSVSSDGCKLAKYKDVSITHEAEETYSFTLPRKPSNIAMTMLSSMDMDVKLAFTDKCVVMSNENFKLTSRLIEGRFPKYESVIPKEYKFDAKVDKKTIISALKRVLPMGSQASELVSFKIGGNKMVIAAEDFDFSKSATETITCDYDERKDPITIGFKGSVLMQVLSNLDGDDVVMELTEPSRAAVIYDNDKDKYLSLIMPMLVS